MKFETPSISKLKEHIYEFFIFKFFNIYLKVHYQDCQNKPLSRDPPLWLIPDIINLLEIALELKYHPGEIISC
jgi:hypothetical protein